MFKSLASYQWQYEYASKSSACPSPSPYDLHAQSPCVDHFKDSYDYYSSFPLDVCSYCQSYDHDVNSCPYYDISNESYARLNAIIETMNEQHEHFVSETREFGRVLKKERSLHICLEASKLTYQSLSLWTILISSLIMATKYKIVLCLSLLVV